VRSDMGLKSGAPLPTGYSIGEYSDRTYAKYGKKNWVRYAVTKGLVYNHNGLMSNVDEHNISVGSHGGAENTLEKRRTGEVGGWIKGKDLNPSALTRVWAPQNRREAIWGGLKNRETIATSGARQAGESRCSGGREEPGRDRIRAGSTDRRNTEDQG
jgi:Protein of unknown function (DUF3604)